MCAVPGESAVEAVPDDQIGGGWPRRVREVAGWMAVIDEIVEQALELSLQAVERIVGLRRHLMDSRGRERP